MFSNCLEFIYGIIEPFQIDSYGHALTAKVFKFEIKYLSYTLANTLDAFDLKSLAFTCFLFGSFPNLLRNLFSIKPAPQIDQLQAL